MNVRRLATGLVVAAALLVGTGCSCCHKSTTVSGAPPCCGPGPVPAGAIPVGPPPVNTLSNASPCPNCVR
jgi:hypothetical protein